MSNHTRKPVSRSLRFDIFNRDGFTCQYCGRKPPAVLLELDHLTPVAKGGTNDEMNLVTSCEDCNQGKSAKILGDVRPIPDADTQYLKTEQQRLEFERFLASSERRDAAMKQVIEYLQEVWRTSFDVWDEKAIVSEQVVRGWLARYSPELIVRGIENSIPAANKRNMNWYQAEQMVRYVSAVMRNLAAEDGE